MDGERENGSSAVHNITGMNQSIIRLAVPGMFLGPRDKTENGSSSLHGT
jgi:hypothetical protein